MRRVDAHDNPVTQERSQFQAALVRRAVIDGLPGYRVLSYKSTDELTTGLLREQPVEDVPIAQWPRHRLNSVTIERGIRRALNPATGSGLPLQTRLRIAASSWLNDVGGLPAADCQIVLQLSLHDRKRYSIDN
jgi:hypothetical protein